MCPRVGPILIGDRVVPIKDERIPSYIVIEHGRFVDTRNTLLQGEFGLRTSQHLIVTKSTRREVALFARDLWNADYRDVAFLVFDAGGSGTIIRANVTGHGITLKSVGSCNPSANDVNRIPAFAADSRRFCPRGGCAVKYGMVTDTAVSFWRKEDTLKLKREQTTANVCSYLHGDIALVQPSAANPAYVKVGRRNGEKDLSVGNRLSSLLKDLLVCSDLSTWQLCASQGGLGMRKVGGRGGGGQI